MSGSCVWVVVRSVWSVWTVGLYLVTLVLYSPAHCGSTLNETRPVNGINSNDSSVLILTPAPSTGDPRGVRLSDESKLVNLLLNRYKRNGKYARPVFNAHEQIIVRFGMRLIQLDIIEKEQALKTSVWVRCKWRDQYLTWRPADYGGIRTVTLPWDMVWLPDITLVNTAEAQTEERPADLMVEYTGRVFWAPHKVYKSACLIDVTNFPYDEHTCYMWFQSMSRYSWHLDLQQYPNSPWNLDTYLGSFKESQEWQIRENMTERFSHSKDVGVQLKFSRRPSLRFSLTVRRRLGYTCHLLMMPCVFLISMTLVVFCLPPERPDRHSLAMNIFGSFLVLLLILVGVAPPTAASIPKLGTYYACNMTLVMLSIFLSGTVVNVSRRGETRIPVPPLVKFVFIDVLAHVLLYYGRVAEPFHAPPSHRCTPEPVHTDHSIFSDGEDSGLNLRNQSSRTYPLQDQSNGKGETSELIVQMDHKLQKLEHIVTSIATDQGESKDYGMRVLRAQWRNIALVMDRFFFVLYFVVIIITLIILFPWPNFQTV